MRITSLAMLLIMVLSLPAQALWPWGKKKAKRNAEPVLELYNDDERRGELVEPKPRPAKREETVSAKRVMKTAEEGSPSAQLMLGRMYFEGRGGVEQSYEKAHRWFKASAKQGDPVAAFNYAICLDAGYGTEKNGAEALRWYEQAARQGIREAQLNAALTYETRDEYPKAITFFRMAADAGDVGAMHKAAELLLKRVDDPSALADGVAYLERGAAQGDHRAQVKL
ncbi:MAG: sel1 repeat family protein, partial [Lentisphaerae bacterium]|nr:sel1 repeat family protein [Lentisphaerota bacterium]